MPFTNIDTDGRLTRRVGVVLGVERTVPVVPTSVHLKPCLLGVPFDHSVYGVGNLVVHFDRRVLSLRDAREADDDCAVFGRVDFPILVVDGERLTLSVANLSVLGVVGFRLSDGLVLNSRVEVVVDAGSGHGLPEVAILPSVDTELLGVTVEASSALPLFPP